jgi:hypothetical protein
MAIGMDFIRFGVELRSGTQVITIIFKGSLRVRINVSGSVRVR